jgi:hypothetical protein
VRRLRGHALTAAAVLAAGCTAAGAREAGPSPTPLSASGLPLVRTAERVALARPGFWPPGQPFGIAKPREAVLVVSDVAPESLFTALPSHVLPRVLRGRAYVAHGLIRGLHSTGGVGFDLRARIVPGTEMTLVPMRDDPGSTVDFLVHESFHAFQLRTFAQPRREDDAFDTESASRPEFTSLIDLERRLLVQALGAPGRDSLERVVRTYLAVRERRYASTAESVRAEELHLERIEGSAHYVGLTAAAVGDGRQRPGPIEGAVIEHLNAELDAPDPRWEIRMRSYGTGAAIAIVLERLNVADWKARLQAGATFHELLARAVPLGPAG